MLAVIETPMIFLIKSFVKQMSFVIAEAVPTGVLQEGSLDLYPLCEEE